VPVFINPQRGLGIGQAGCDGLHRLTVQYGSLPRLPDGTQLLKYSRVDLGRVFKPLRLSSLVTYKKS
jgi:hypothetical protein